MVPLPTLTLAELREKAFQKARRGPRSSAAGITYGQAAERALEIAGADDAEQLAHWWVREKLDAGMFVSDEWCGEPGDLPLEVGRDLAGEVVALARDVWTHVIFEAFRAGLQAGEDTPWEADG